MSPIVSTAPGLTSLCSSTSHFSVPYCSFLPFWLLPLREVPALHAFSPEMLPTIRLVPTTSPRLMWVASSTGYSATAVDLIRILFYMQGTFDWITATFTVPTTSGSTEASASAFIGIACDTTSFLYAGVTFTVASNGQSEYTGKDN